MSNRFVGRKKELEYLRNLLKRESASLVVVTGRRGIGKSALIQEFSKGHTFYNFTALAPTSSLTNDGQLASFAYQLAQQTEWKKVALSDWLDAFSALADCAKSGRVIILFDEISWMGSKDPHFLDKLKEAWDKYFKNNSRLILILSGSISSYIEKNILCDNEFKKRISGELALKELPFNECREFWSSHSFTSYDMLKVLSITGGVPRYLDLIHPGLTADENIIQLCFETNGMLVLDFNYLFSSFLAPKNDDYKKIVIALSKGPLKIQEVCNRVKTIPLDELTEDIHVLIRAGFITKFFSWDRDYNGLYRLSDNYVRFYLKYIDERFIGIQGGSVGLGAFPKMDTIIQFQFSNMVVNNRRYIKSCLGLESADDTYCNSRASIDCLVYSKDQNLFVCEAVFSKEPLGEEVIDKMKQNIERLSVPKGFSIRPVLIHVNGVQQSVIDSGYFTKVIDFGEIFTSDFAPYYQDKGFGESRYADL